MKKSLFILLPFFFVAFAATAQVDPAKDPSVVYTKAEHMPAYKGGDSAWFRFLQKNLNYPVEAQNKEQQGTVMVGFIVDTTGKLSAVEAITKPAKSLVEEAIRIIKLSDGNWEPATQNGYKVRCYAKKPITFKLEN